jgi:hypothetical protein
MTTDHVSERTKRTWRSWRWRGAYVVVLVAAVGALVAGIAYASLTATGSGTGSASTGSVSLSVNASATTTCTYPTLKPGDLTGTAAEKCALSVTYTGSISAFVSLTVAIQSKAGSGGHLLYDGTNTNGLTFSITDGHNTFTVPTGAGTTGSPCPAGYTCWTASNELAAWYGGSGTLTFTSGDAVTWTVTPLFPKTVGNTYQGAAASLTLTALAVQAPANPLPATCTTSTIGQSCPASGSFAWS